MKGRISTVLCDGVRGPFSMLYLIRAMAPIASLLEPKHIHVERHEDGLQLIIAVPEWMEEYFGEHMPEQFTK